jgi:hypothetical protein
MQPTVPSHFRKDFGPPFPRDREAPPILPIIVYDAKKIPLVQGPLTILWGDATRSPGKSFVSNRIIWIRGFPKIGTWLLVVNWYDDGRRIAAWST